MKKLIDIIQNSARCIRQRSFWVSLGTFCLHLPPRVYLIALQFGAFFILLFVFIFAKFYGVLLKIPLVNKPLSAIFFQWDKRILPKIMPFLRRIDTSKDSKVKRSFLIAIGFKNLMVKKTRTLITIFGMSVGVGIIVLLLSLGYGIEKLIISQVASLSELKIIDVATSDSTSLHLNNDIIKRIKGIKNVESATPVVSLVGRMSYNNANTDVLAYAASNEYLELLNIKLLKGTLFSGKLATSQMPDVQGVQTTIPHENFGSLFSQNTLDFTVQAGTVATAWEDCTQKSKVLGVTKRIEGGFRGKGYWGEQYDRYAQEAVGFDHEKQIYLSKWIKGSVPLYYQTGDYTLLPILDDHGVHLWKDVCLQANEVQILQEYSLASVLSEATSSAEVDFDTASDSAVLTFDTSVVATDEAGLEVVSLETEIAKAKKENKLAFPKSYSRQAIVSSGLLAVYSIPIQKAIGTKFKTSFIITKALLPNIDGKTSTDEVEYEIVGIIDDEDGSYFYIPFSDTQQLKVPNFSQLKVLMGQKETLAEARKQIETMGFRTSSTFDTVAQIESLFANLRIVLGLLGLVALGVAALGMFNTLTVSLLERTREIGGMKTMGMVSHEVQDLFLAEAMIMGLAGGFGGLFLGYIAGDFLSFILSLFAFASGDGYIDVSYIPPFLTLFIIFSSFVVGVVTGLYPAQRAKKISALNALRYE